MDKYLKAVIQWSMYIFCAALLIIGFIVPMIRLTVLDNDLVKLVDWMSWSSVGISLISLGLAIFSMILSSRDGKQSQIALKEIREIQQEENTSMAEIKIIFKAIQDSQKMLNQLQQNAQTTLNDIRSISKSIQDNQEGVVSRLLDANAALVQERFKGKKTDWHPDETGRNE